LLFTLRRSRGATGRYQGPTGAPRRSRRRRTGPTPCPGGGKGLTPYCVCSTLPWYVELCRAGAQIHTRLPQSPHAQQFARAIHHAQPAPNPWLHWLLAFTHTCPKAPMRNSHAQFTMRSLLQSFHSRFARAIHHMYHHNAVCELPALLHPHSIPLVALSAHSTLTLVAVPQHPRHQPTHGLIRAVRCTSALKWRTLARPAGARAVHAHLVLIALALAQLARTLLPVAPLTVGTVCAGGRRLSLA